MNPMQTPRAYGNTGILLNPLGLGVVQIGEPRLDDADVGRVLQSTLPAMAGMGFIAKRAVANHPWRLATRPVGDYCEEYWTRWQAMRLDNRGLEWGEISRVLHCSHRA